MKAQRHSAILRLVRQNRVHSQDQLRDLLAEERIDITQATLSRDIRDLRLAKVADPSGGAYYTIPPERETPILSLQTLLPALLLSVHGVGPFVVVRTPQGSAEALGGALDVEAWSEVIGTIAGDDTLLIITRNDEDRERTEAKLREIAGFEPN
jgi:transcriptional regulator of arginine metabolism